MAAAKGQDPFEAFKQKKVVAEKQQKEQARVDDANKKAGWVEGIGPQEKQQDPTKPKGYMKGRYAKVKVAAEELAKLRPDDYEATKIAKKPPTDVKKLPPEEKRRPGSWERF
jgi:hypothetical protein